MASRLSTTFLLRQTTTSTNTTSRVFHNNVNKQRFLSSTIKTNKNYSFAAPTTTLLLQQPMNTMKLTSTTQRYHLSSSSSSSAAASPSPSTTSTTSTNKETFLPVDQVTERVLSVVKSFPKIDAKKVTPKANFMTDLGLDSLDTVELVMMFEEEFVLTIPDDQAEKILTIEDAVNFISKHPQAR
jgi:acyl carrier protein